MEIVAELADVEVVQELPVPGETVVNDTTPEITSGKAFVKDGSSPPLGVPGRIQIPLGDTAVTTTPEVALTTGGGQNEPKKDSPSARVKDLLLKNKAERLAKLSHPLETVEPKLPEQPVEPSHEREEKKVKSQEKTTYELQQHAKALLPERPKGLEQVEYVTAEQQQPAKPRGRKPRTTKKDDEPTTTKKDDGPTTAVTTKGNSSKRSNTTKPEQPEKKPRKTSKEEAPPGSASTRATAPKASAKPKAKAKISKSKGEYEAMQVDGDVGRETGATFDAYAAASAAADVHKLSQPSPAPIENDKAEPPTKRSRKASKSSDQKGKDGGDEVVNGAEKVEGVKAAGSKASGRSAESKALLSRKSCAYKRALNIKLKEGATREDAQKAARDVSYFECDGVV